MVEIPHANLFNIIDYHLVINRILVANGLIIIRSFPLLDKKLGAFVDTFSRVLIEKRNNDEDCVFDVKISHYKGIFQSQAQSPHHFDFHTDCSHFKDVPSGVCFLCVQPSPYGGDSLICDLDAVIADLQIESIHYLLNRKWYMDSIKRPILKLDDGVYKIIYNRAVLTQCNELAPMDTEMLDQLENAFKKHQTQFRLEAGDLLMMNNHRTLHGRTSFDINSGRLLKRVRFYF